MNQKKIVCILTVLLFVSLSAAFEEKVEGIETKAMGGSRTARLDADTVNQNPAVTPTLEGIHIGVSGNLADSDADEGQFRGVNALGAVPLKIAGKQAGVNVGFLYKALSGIDYPGVSGTPYYEMQGQLGVGIQPISLISVGIGLKFHRWAIGIDKQAAEANNINMNAGVLVPNLVNLLNIGLSIDNIFGGDVSSGASSHAETLPRIMSLGVSLGDGFTKTLPLSYLGIDADWTLGDNLVDLKVGGAVKLLANKKLTIGAGCFISENFSAFTPTLGASLNLINILDIQYAFNYPFAELGSAGRHYLGVMVKL